MIFKKSFSIIELTLVIILIAIISTFLIPKNLNSNLNQAANTIITHLKNTRYQAMLDNKFNHKDNKWFRQRWTFKFMRCSFNVGGLYYVIYSDTNKLGHANVNESLKDPLSQKWVYASNKCKQNQYWDKNVLLTKEYGVSKIVVSCNSTNAIGQFSFGYDGKVYTKLTNETYGSHKNELKKPCMITLYGKTNENVTIIVEPNTGFIYKR